MSAPPSRLPFDETVPAAPCRELHQRLVAAPIELVWPHCLDVPAREIRTPGPLMALRSMPARITGKGTRSASAPRALLDAVDLGDGTTRIETETLVAGTDQASTIRFRPNWMVIRLPSGLIRRSWLAAIDRRACR